MIIAYLSFIGYAAGFIIHFMNRSITRKLDSDIEEVGNLFQVLRERLTYYMGQDMLVARHPFAILPTPLF